MSYNLTIKRDKVSRHLLIFSIFGSDVSQRSILGPLFFLINSLSNNIVALAIKQCYLHADACSYISGILTEDLQIQLKVFFY